MGLSGLARQPSEHTSEPAAQRSQDQQRTAQDEKLAKDRAGRRSVNNEQATSRWHDGTATRCTHMQNPGTHPAPAVRCEFTREARDQQEIEGNEQRK